MFTLPNLPYPADALEPVLSAELMHFHHDKHHAAYVNKLNELLGQAGKSPDTLEAAVADSAGGAAPKVFNNAAQAWNHAFLWECMTPTAGKPEGALAQAIGTTFGDLASLKAKFVDEGVNHFASGWVWIVAEGGKLSVISTHDADTAIVKPGLTPVLVCDLWEHAYYLVHKNDRKSYLEKWFDGLANWGFAAAQYAAATGSGQAYSYPKPVAAA